MQGSFNFNIRKGSFVLSKLHWKNDTIGTLFRDHDGFEVIVSGDEKGIEFDIPLLNVEVKSGKDKGGQVIFRDLGKLVARFPFLKRYHLSDGEISFSSKNWKKPYHFQGAITYPYSIFVVGGSPVNHYGFSGTIGTEGISAQVLKKFSVMIDEKITITSKNVEYNIVEIVKLLKNISKKKSASSVLTVRGVGNASVLEYNIDLKLNLITQGRKDLSKIPLVGYVLVGDEEVPSITLEVTGNLSDPDIRNSAFEEIVTLPFDIGLRVLKSPFKWIENVLSDEDSSTNSDSN